MSQGSRDGAVVRALTSHLCVPGLTPGPGVICGPSLLLVLFLALRGFSPGTSVFPSPQKPTFPNSNSIWIILKQLFMSLWLGWSHKHSLCLTLNLHHFTFTTISFITFHCSLQSIDGINFSDQNTSTKAPQGLHWSLTNIAVSGNNTDFTSKHDVCCSLETINKRFTNSIEVVKFALGDRVIDIDGRNL